MRRSRHRMKMDLVRLVETPTNRTAVIYQGNFNPVTGGRILDELVERGLILEIPDDRYGRKYVASEEGMDWVRRNTRVDS